MKKMVLAFILCSSLGAHEEGLKKALSHEFSLTEWFVLLQYTIAKAETIEEAARAVGPLIPSAFLQHASMKSFLRKIFDKYFQERSIDDALLKALDEDRIGDAELLKELGAQSLQDEPIEE